MEKNITLDELRIAIREHIADATITRLVGYKMRETLAISVDWDYFLDRIAGNGRMACKSRVFSTPHYHHYTIPARQDDEARLMEQLAAWIAAGCQGEGVTELEYN